MVVFGIALLPLLASLSLASPTLGVCFYFLHAIHLETIGFKVVADLSCWEVDWGAFQSLGGACDGVVVESIGGCGNFVVVVFGGGMVVAVLQTEDVWLLGLITTTSMMMC